MGSSNFVVWNGTVVQPVIITDGTNNVVVASGVPSQDAMGLVVRTAGPQEIVGSVTVSGVNGISVEISGLTNLAINNFPSVQNIAGGVYISGGSVTINNEPPVQIWDANTGFFAAVKATTPVPNEFGLVVRNIPGGIQQVDGSIAITGTPTFAVSNFPATQSVAVVSPLGSQLSAASVSVAIASDQSNLHTIIYGDDFGQGGIIATNVVDWNATAFGGLGIGDGQVTGLATTSAMWGTDKTSGNTFPVLVDKSLTKSTKGAPLVTTIAGVVALSGNSTIQVSNFPAIQTIEGTVNVSGVVVEIGTVNVSGLNNVGINNFPVNQQVFGSVTISGSPTIVVSGLNFNADGDLLVDIDAFPADVLVSGNITTNGQTIVMTPQNSTGAIAIQTTGTWTGNLQIEATLDGSNWFSRKGQTSNTSTQVITQNGITVIAGDAYYQIRVRANSTITGTCFVNMRDGIGTQVVSIADSLPPGSNTLGSIILTDGTHTANVDNNGNLDVHISGWFGSSAPTVGSKTSANSIPVVIASDQAAINVIRPPLTMVTGMVGLSGNPQVIAGPLPGAIYPVAGAITISGTPSVSISNFPAIQSIQGTVNISGTPSVTVNNFPSIQSIQGTVNLSGVPQVIAGPLPGATYPVTGKVTLSGTPSIDLLSINGVTVATAGTMPITGHAGAVLDAAGSNAANPGNYIIMGGQFLNSPPTLTDTHVTPLQLDSLGFLKVAIYDSSDSVINTTGGAIKVNIQPGSALIGSVELSDGTNTLGVQTNPIVTSGTPRGQKTMAGSEPVVIASDQSPLPIQGTINLSGTPSVNVAQWIGSTAPTVGSKTSANSLPVVIANDQAAINVMPPPLTMVTGMIGLSGNPLVQAGPLAGATYPITGAVTLSGNPAITYATPTTDTYSEASINFSSASDNVIVSGFGAQTIRVFRIFFVSNGTNNITLKYGATAANQTGPMNYVAGSTFVLDASPNPWFTSVAGSGFIMNGSTSSQVVGRLYYIQS